MILRGVYCLIPQHSPVELGPRGLWGHLFISAPVWAALLFLFHILNPKLAFPGVTSQIDNLPMSPWVSANFWGGPK